MGQKQPVTNVRGVLHTLPGRWVRSPVYYTPIWGRLLEPNISRNQSQLITGPFVRLRFWRELIIYVLIVALYLPNYTLLQA